MKTLVSVLSQKSYQFINVKIGSQSGSSFFYCGKCSSAITTLTTSVNALMKKRMKDEIKRLQERLDNLDEIYRKRLELTIAEGKVQDIEKYQRKQEKMKAQERISIPQEIAIRKEEVEIPLLEREVVEIVNGISPDERPCKIIYIKGHEKGAYWTIDEFIHKKGRYEEDEEKEEI